jgi:serine kinase of HPr protein (carbohydrate metabolism regulator)
MSGLWQATGVAIGGRGLLIEGEPGSGKTSLALALMDRGAELIGDDGVSLTLAGGRLLASPAPATAGLIEVRNVGILRRPCRNAVPVALVIRLDRAAPRHVEAAETCALAGAALPLIRLFPDSPILAIRAELALATHGLPPGSPAQ